MTPGTSSSNGLLAAIDLGSNSFRLEMGRLREGRYRRHACHREAVRMGLGLNTEGLLSQDSIERGLRCLARFAAEIKAAGPNLVRVVATQTLREARNGPAFVQAAQGILGTPVEVISGDEEARLIYAGVAFFHPSPARRLVVDIGGRSTEMILGDGCVPRGAQSFAVGSAGITAAHFPSGALTAEAFRRAQHELDAALGGAWARFSAPHWDEALGCSGTVGAVSSILKANRLSDGTVTLKGLQWIIERCIAAGHVEHLDLAGLKPTRRVVLPGGLAVLQALMRACGIERLGGAKAALRHGVLLDLHAKQCDVHADPITVPVELAIRTLQDRLQIDQAHSRRVAATAAALHRQLGPNGLRHHELRWPAALHEGARPVAKPTHPLHRSSLMRRAPLPGVSGDQHQRLGALMQGQRGGLRKLGASLHDRDFVDQLLCLRLALICCKERSGEPPPLPERLTRRGQAVHLTVPKGWQTSHPRTLQRLHREVERWSRSGALHLVLEAAR